MQQPNHDWTRYNRTRQDRKHHRENYRQYKEEESSWNSGSRSSQAPYAPVHEVSDGKGYFGHAANSAGGLAVWPDDKNVLCKTCNYHIKENFSFCPNCSVVLKDESNVVLISKEKLPQDPVTAPREFAPGAANSIERTPMPDEARANVYVGTNLEKKATADIPDKPFDAKGVSTIAQWAQKCAKELKRAQETLDGNGESFKSILAASEEILFTNTTKSLGEKQ